MKFGKIEKSFALLFVILISTVTLYFYQNRQFNQKINTEFIKQQLSFPYYLKPGKDIGYSMLLGDLNGLNRNAYESLLALITGTYGTKNSWVIVPSIMPEKSAVQLNEVEESDFFEQVANKRGVVLVDNFCTSEWENIKKKQIYELSSLSPGPFCFSEKETRDLNRLIKTMSIKKVYLIYDVESYLEFISNFTGYLEENEIDYEFVRSYDTGNIKDQI